MKVYVVVTTNVWDGCEEPTELAVFANEGDAQKHAREVFDKFEVCDGWEVEKSKYCMCAYEDGEYSENHFLVEVREENVR